MAMWRIQSGSMGELEDAIDRNAVAIPWQELPDLSAIKAKDELVRFYERFHPNLKPQQVTVAVGQIWAFLDRVHIGDWVVVPRKRQSAIAVGVVESAYEYRNDLGKYARHTRRVRWVQKSLPRSKFEQDLLYLFRGILTVCQLTKNEAEVRIRRIAEVRS